MKSSWQGRTVFTVGHSTRPLEELVLLLRAFGVITLVDIRTIPRSRHNPQFNAEAMPAALRPYDLGYLLIPDLGGLRRRRKDSPNTAWRNASFQGYADHMLTETFEAGLRTLEEAAADQTCALMCAEAVHWRCHRSLVADALTVRGADVRHISSARRATPHRLTPFARVEGFEITDPAVP